MPREKWAAISARVDRLCTLAQSLRKSNLDSDEAEKIAEQMQQEAAMIRNVIRDLRHGAE